jgi:ADP-ribose pyrophosphatase YjhB (NUDIX family)
MTGINLWGDEPRSYRLSAGVYALRDGKAAFLRRASGAMVGFWSIPGGRVDAGEDPLTAAVRELREESGLQATEPLEYLCALPMQGYGDHILRFFYVTQIATGEVVLSDEHSDAAWLTPREYRDQHLNDAELARWMASDASEGFNVLANRAAIDALIARLDG